MNKALQPYVSTRLRILLEIKRRPVSMTLLSALLNMREPTLRRHMNGMKPLLNKKTPTDDKRVRLYELSTKGNELLTRIHDLTKQ